MRLDEEWTFGYPGGENDSAVATAFPDTDVLSAINLRIAPDGMLEVRYGSQRLNPTARDSGSQCYGLTYFRPTGATAQLIAAFGDKLEYSTNEGATWTEIANTLTEAFWDFCTITVTTGTTYLICANGNDTFRWDGTTWTELTNWPTGVKYVETFNNRVYGAGHHRSHVIATAIVDVVGDLNLVAVPDGLVIPVHTHDGDGAIVGLKEWRGMMYVGKRESVSIIDGYGNATLVVATGAKGATRAVGWVGNRSVCAAGDSVLYWLSERGIEEYRGGGDVSLASRKKRKSMRSISWDKVFATPELPCAIYDVMREEVRFALPSAAAARNETCLLLNVQTGGITTLAPTASADQGTLTLVNGDLTYVTNFSYQFGELVNGDLRLKPLGAPGLVPFLTDGDLSFAGGQSTDVAAYAIMELAGEPNAVLSGGFDGFIRRLEHGTLDDVTSTGSGGGSYTASLVGQPTRLQEKWARVVQVFATAAEDTTLTVGVRTDGVETARRAMALRASDSDHPRENQVNVTGRGWIHEPWLDAIKPGMKVAGIRVASRRLTRKP